MLALQNNNIFFVKLTKPNCSQPKDILYFHLVSKVPIDHVRFFIGFLCRLIAGLFLVFY